MEMFRRSKDTKVAEHTSTLTELLLRKRWVSHADVEQAAAEQDGAGMPIGELLVSRGALERRHLTLALAEHFELPAFDPKTRVEPEATQLVPKSFADQYLLLPLRVDAAASKLTVAVSMPQNSDLVGYVEQRCGYELDLTVADSGTLREAIADAYGSMDGIERHLEAFDDARGEIGESSQAVAEIQAITEDAPVVRIVNILIAEGLRQRASDIHIEPEETHVRVRYRVDGTLREVQQLPAKLAAALASRIKVMASLDIVERHRSQDGQCVATVDGRQVDVRVATAETLWGEKIVLRLLDRQKAVIDLGELGMPADTAAAWRHVISVPFGLVVVAGPTGAGKTTTLYASLNELDRRTRNITTIEDPVEYIFPGIVQMPIKQSAGRTFADGLRAILRQDPDVVLVGEVRDQETAEIASQAALTGHAVFCSVHATDCVSTVFRFLDMGVESYLIAPALEAIVSQRLVRRICRACAVQYTPPPQELAVYRYLTGSDRSVFWHGAGCTTCSGTGYFERVGIYELLRVTDDLRNMIAMHAQQSDLRDAALNSGMVTLLQAALRKVEENETTISEVVRTVYSG